MPEWYRLPPAASAHYWPGYWPARLIVRLAAGLIAGLAG